MFAVWPVKYAVPQRWCRASKLEILITELFANREQLIAPDFGLVVLTVARRIHVQAPGGLEELRAGIRSLCEPMGLGKRQFCLDRLRAFLEDQRAAELQLCFELEARAKRRIRDLLRFAQREIERADRLDERQAFAGSVGEEQPEMKRLFELSGAAVVMRQKFRLVLGDLRELALKGFGDTGVKCATRLAQQSAIGRVLHQRMLEEIDRMRGHALAE